MLSVFLSSAFCQPAGTDILEGIYKSFSVQKVYIGKR
jgi:hypothetical protein